MQIVDDVIAAAAATKSVQSCPTLCDPGDGNPLGSSVPGILQARTLEWVAISFSNAWKWKVKGKSLSRVRLFRTPWTAAYQAPPSMGFSRQEYWSGCHRLLPCHCSSFYFLWVLVSFTSSVAPGVLSLMRFHALSHKGRCLTQGPAESAVYLCDISNYCREGCETQAWPVRFQSELVTNTWYWKSQLFAYLSTGQHQTHPWWWPEPISSLFFLASLLSPNI